jgi:lycopene cyclase-like protein
VARHDVVVAGSGPAGWSTAVVCAEAGLSTVLVAPEPTAAWPATYRSWVDDLTGLGYGHVFSHQWSAVTAVGEQTRRVERAYGRVDGAKLAAHLMERGAKHGLTVQQGRSVGVSHDRVASALLLASGQVINAAVVIDATGAAGSLVHGRGPATAWQTAYGIIATPSVPLNDTGCVLMDFATGAPHDRPPTFLYAQDLGDGRWFLEETVLASREATLPAHLNVILHDRLQERGIVLTDVVEIETVAIPMGLRVPLPQRVIAVGASGGAIHPATGYSLTTSLHAAPKLAHGIVAALERRATPSAVSEAGWAAMWPDARRRARSLQEYGLAVMLGMDRGGLQRFFDQFFSLPEHDQRAYLGPDAGGREIAGVMSRLWLGAPNSLRMALAKGDPRRLLRAIG